jgi:alpha-L-fucosidase
VKTETEILKIVDDVIAQGPYRPEWGSLMTSPVPHWFRQRKLGIFIHWGVYSVPAKFNEWYSRNMYIKDTDEYHHHIKTYGPHSAFGYKDFIPMFKAEKFDAKAWMELFKQAGAGYVLPVAEHHDGFQMYESCLSCWNAAQMGPKRDVLGELMTAAEAEGLVFCASTHRAEHWFFMSHGREYDSDVKDPMEKGDFYWPAMPERDHFDRFSQPAPTEEYLNDWLARTAEIVLKYRPKILYFDWWIQHSSFKPYLLKLAAFYYNCGRQWGTDVRICYKHDAMMFGSGIVEVERGALADAKPYPWQTDTAVARNSWCHTEDLVYKSSNEIICTLVDVVSKGGNLLLNIGPKADGSIPEGDRKILEDLGAWMTVNGEAIHGAQCWRRFAEGPTAAAEGQFQDKAEVPYTAEDYRFTVANGAIYAICMKCPQDGNFTVHSLKTPTDFHKPEFQGIIQNVELLGGGTVDWQADQEALRVSAGPLDSPWPVVLKVTLR